MCHVTLLFPFSSSGPTCLAGLWLLGQHHLSWSGRCEHLCPAVGSSGSTFLRIMWCQEKGKSISFCPFIGHFGLFCQWLFAFHVPDETNPQLEKPSSLPLLWFWVCATHESIPAWDGFVWRATFPSLHCSKRPSDAVSSARWDHLVKLFNCSIFHVLAGAAGASSSPRWFRWSGSSAAHTSQPLPSAGTATPVLWPMSLHHPPWLPMVVAQVLPLGGKRKSLVLLLF